MTPSRRRGILARQMGENIMRVLCGIMLVIALAACGPTPATKDGGAPEGASSAPTNAEASAADKAAILEALQLTADASGQVKNECGEPVTPQYLPADVGAGIGRALLFVIGGGPNMASCYGDGPDVHLMRQTGDGWKNVYSNRGGPMVILPTQHNGANDLADGGPGFSFPVWEWNGEVYANAKRQVSDKDLGADGVRFMP